MFPTEKINKAEAIPTLENTIYNRFEPTMVEEAMKHVSIILTAKDRMKETTHTSSWMNFIRMRTTTFFKEHKDLLVVNSDKGKHSVVMYETDYDDKMQGMLNDETTYERTTDVRDENIQRNADLVGKLIECGTMEGCQRYRHDDATATIARIYGLPKIHKEGAPLRPITSTVNAPGTP